MNIFILKLKFNKNLMISPELGTIDLQSNLKVSNITPINIQHIYDLIGRVTN